MKILYCDENLLWTSRLKLSIQALGHEPIQLKLGSEIPDGVEVAIVNLGMEAELLKSTIENFKEKGIIVIGHAGHKEKNLLQLGKDFGVDRLATNSELTNKLGQIIETIHVSTQG